MAVTTYSDNADSITKVTGITRLYNVLYGREPTVEKRAHSEGLSVDEFNEHLLRLAADELERLYALPPVDVVTSMADISIALATLARTSKRHQQLAKKALSGLNDLKRHTNENSIA